MEHSNKREGEEKAKAGAGGGGKAPPKPSPRPNAKFRLPEWAVFVPHDSEARLAIEKQGERLGKIALGGRWATVLGRNPALSDEVVDHTTVSREHAAVVFDGQAFKLMDLGSAQGTDVDGSPLPANEWVVLRDGMRVKFAESSREYVCKGVGSGSRKRKLDDDGGGGGRKVRCLHILAKHRDSRNPHSWRNPDANITRTSEEARALIQKHVDALKGAGREAFEDAARAVSECSSAKRGGDLGVFGRGKMHPPFENAAFALQVGEVSGVVSSPSGFHVIRRVE